MLLSGLTSKAQICAALFGCAVLALRRRARCHASGTAAEFIAMWRSGANDAAAHAKLAQLLARCPLAGRVITWNPGDPASGRLLSADEWRRLSWVFGPEALPGFLGLDAAGICLQLGFGARWLRAKLATGKRFKLAVFPAASTDACLATWDGVEHMLRRKYTEAWRRKIAPHWAHIRGNSFAQLQAEAGYNLLDINLAGRDPTTGESEDARYVSLQRLMRPNYGSSVHVRQFLWDEIGIKDLFSGHGRTVNDDGTLGPLEYLCRNVPLADISGCCCVDIVPEL